MCAFADKSTKPAQWIGELIAVKADVLAPIPTEAKKSKGQLQCGMDVDQDRRRVGSWKCNRKTGMAVGRL